MVNYYGLEWVRLGQTLATVRLVGRKKPTLGLQMRDRKLHRAQASGGESRQRLSTGT